MSIPERQDALDSLTREYLTAPEPIPSSNGYRTLQTVDLADEAVISLARGAKNGDKFSGLYDHGSTAGYDGDDSRADQALASVLAFWTQNPDQIERIISGSALGQRRKWRDRPDYRKRTIDFALRNLGETYTLGSTATLVAASDLEELEHTALEEVRRRSRFERVDLAGAIRDGVARQEELVPSVIYRGHVTAIISAGGLGKTFMALYLIAEVIRRSENVILVDLENGVRIIADRLRDQGVSAEQVQKHLTYIQFPRPDLSDEALAEFEGLLEEVDPALVVFDSWIGCLAAAGLDENSAVDIQTWAEEYPQRARVRGIAVLIIDHVPKEGGSARGSGRKLDYVDVLWELKNPRKFDRENVGRIDLRLKKDRLGWLPRGLMFNVGGGKDGFVFERNLTSFASAEEETDLLPSDETTLEALRSLGSMGAFDKEWREEAMSQGLSRATYYRARETLLRLELVEQVMKKFFIKAPAKPRSHEVSNESHETNETRRMGEVSRGLTPLKGETRETSRAETSTRSAS